MEFAGISRNLKESLDAARNAAKQAGTLLEIPISSDFISKEAGTLLESPGRVPAFFDRSRGSAQPWYALSLSLPARSSSTLGGPFNLDMGGPAAAPLSDQPAAPREVGKEVDEQMDSITSKV